MIQSPGSTENTIESLLALLEKGCIPWRHRRRCRGLGLQQRNLISGQAYAGPDSILLAIAMSSRGTSLPLWCTYGEARAVGLAARRGSKGITLGLAQTGQSRSPRQVTVFNVADLVGPTFQQIVARRRRATRRANGERRQRVGKLDGSWPRQLIQARRDPACLGLEDRPPGDVGQKPRSEFLQELAWSMLVDLTDVDWECGVFVLAEADWIQLLRTSPQSFFDLLTDAGKAVDRLNLETRGEGMC